MATSDSPGYNQANLHQTDHSQAETVGGHDYYYLPEEELPFSNNARREIELDRKRQAMFELRDRQVKFFRKCKQENNKAKYLTGQVQCSHEEQDIVFKSKEKKKKKGAKKSKDRMGYRDTLLRDEGEYNTNDIQGMATPSDHTKVLPRIHDTEDYPVIYENDSSLRRPPPDNIKFPGQPMRTGFKSEMDEKACSTQIPQAPVRRNHMHLPPIQEKLHDSHLLPPVYKIPKKFSAHSPLPQPQQQEDHGQRISLNLQSVKVERPDKFQTVYTPLPSIKERQPGTYQDTTPTIDVTETNSGDEFDSGVELDTGYAFGISAHVVEDEDLRNELRLDLRFAKTPVAKKESKNSPKHSKNKTARIKARGQKEGEGRI
ncbi:uncharacterized protein LOC123559941 [Mercenaria mercenaria]|uniref:uncharacterized protein LOC123559941 n=1 Tax=Mercenaria mercenaria TaxID=6596 RepID=UPI00234ECA89|nr:uncharacterized protein LOC123559941 [Mercenaria mercenaria]